MTEKDKKEFARVRKILMDAIHKELEIDPCCKSYEGTFEVTMCYPSYFDDPDATSEPELYQITLHCYVIGPARHYDWCGGTFKEALNKCKADLVDWGLKV